MRIQVPTTIAIEVSEIRVAVPVRYDEEDIPNKFPLRKGDMWTGTIDITTGKIRDWPAGKTGEMQMKVVDEGRYYLLNSDGEAIASIEQDYVPSCIPGEFGDYIQFIIAADGGIAGWGKFCTLENVMKSFWPKQYGDKY